MDSGIAIRCGTCRGRGWRSGWFQRCSSCRGRGWFDPSTAPGEIGVLVAAADAVRTGACPSLLVRPALPWERFPVPDAMKSPAGGPDDATWQRAVRGSAVILYEHVDGRTQLAGGLELVRLDETWQLLRALCWRTLPDGGLWRCVDRRLHDVYLRLSFFRAWRGEWLEVTRWTSDASQVTPPARQVSSAAQKYVTGKLFVGAPKENE